MAQRYEIEAWVNPEVWDDQEQAQRAIDLIEQSGADDEATWVRLAVRAAGDDPRSAPEVIAAAARDVDRAAQREAISVTAAQRADALAEADEHTATLRSMVIDAAADGVPETQLAQAAGVTRMTIRSWIGK